MYRKHTRRAAKAAFAVSLGVALLIGLAACGGGGGGNTTTTTTTTQASNKPTIVLGSKNFPEETLLGQLYGQALKVKGFKVVYKPSIGSSELIDTAIKSGKINFYPDYIGIIALDLAKVKNPPATAQATYDAAKTYEQKSDLTLLKMTPFEDVDTFTMLTKTANNLAVHNISDMKKVAHFSYAGYPECQTRITCLLGLKNIYGLKQVTFKPLSTISIYTLLDNGTVTAGDGFSTDPQQLQTKKYTALVDTKHIFGYQNVAPVVSQKLLTGPNAKLLEDTANAVSAKLTLAAMLQMNKAVVVAKVSPAYVATRFLQANGLK
jgi:osmoprotectant transport system substrate-binding protein